jgi:hypothetical protein
MHGPLNVKCCAYSEEILPDGKGHFCCISLLCDALMATF